MKKTTAITQSALASELRCARSTISRLVERGMPTLADGRVDRTVALQHIIGLTAGSAGGWTSDMKGASIRDRALKLLDGGKPSSKAPKPAAKTAPPKRTRRQRPAPAAEPEPEPAARELAEALLLQRGRLPELLARLGASLELALIAMDVWDAAFLCGPAGRLLERLYGSDFTVGGLGLHYDESAVAGSLNISTEELRDLEGRIPDSVVEGISAYMDFDPSYLDKLNPIPQFSPVTDVDQL